VSQPSTRRADAGPAPQERPANAFARLWRMQLVGQVGGKVALALFPILAATTYLASPLVVGVTNGLQYLPVVLVSILFAGAIDRWDRRLCLTVGFAATGVVLGAALLLDPHARRIWVLVLAALLVGCLVAFTDLCAQTLPPDLVDGSRLVTANGRLEIVYSLCQVCAPGAAGVLISGLSGSTSLGVAAVAGFAAALLASALWLPHRVPAPRPAGWRSMVTALDGVRLLLRDPVLRPLSLQASAFNMLETGVLTLYLVHAARYWNMPAVEIGLPVTIGGIGTLGSAAVVGSAVFRPRPYQAIVVGMAIASLLFLAIPFAPGAGTTRMAYLAGIFLVYGFGMTLFNIFAVSARQKRSPEGMLGRVSAAYRLLAFTPISIGALLAGLSATAFGSRTSLIGWCLVLDAAFVVFTVAVTRRRRELDRTFTDAAEPAP
jgi:MFS family permease